MVFALPTLGTAAESAKEKVAETSETKAKPKLEWYGYVKLDASWDESLIESGNFARWAASPSLIDEHSHVNLTARQTRFGFRVEPPHRGGPRLSARLESDFYGGGAENKNWLQLRHAYAQIDWQGQGMSLVAGQTSDLISPLVPSTLNYTVAWWAGNIGYRRPQARITRTFAAGDEGAVVVAAALSRTIGDDFGATEPGDSGADSGVPTVQLRAARRWSGGEVGLSGHWGSEILREAPEDPRLEVDSWSANLDLALRFSARVSLKAEAWTGENLDDYFGAIGQGVNFGRGEAIGASGGWLALAFAPRAGLEIGLGAGLDDPDDELLAVGARARNLAVWANAVWELWPGFKAGGELSSWQTDYLGIEDGSSLRAQTSLIYSF
jgi:hypothetical protein